MKEIGYHLFNKHLTNTLQFRTKTPPLRWDRWRRSHATNQRSPGWFQPIWQHVVKYVTVETVPQIMDEHIIENCEHTKINQTITSFCFALFLFKVFDSLCLEDIKVKQLELYHLSRFLSVTFRMRFGLAEMARIFWWMYLDIWMFTCTKRAQNWTWHESLLAYIQLSSSH